MVNPKPTCTVEPATKEVCAGGSATFTALPVGGTAGYSYLWSNGATTPSITVSEANTYTVTVTDSKGCTTELRGHVGGQSEADLVHGTRDLIRRQRDVYSRPGGSPWYTTRGATARRHRVSRQ